MQLRVKELVTSICVTIPFDAYERTRHFPEVNARQDPVILEILSKLENAGLPYQYLVASGLVLVRASKDTVIRVLGVDE